METKKLIKIKKGATIKDTMLVIIMFIGGLGLFYAFALNNAFEAGVTPDPKFNDSMIRLQASQDNVTKLVTDLQNATASLTEAKIGDYAFFGLRGILLIMKLPLTLISVASDSWSVVSYLLPIPDAAKIIIIISILIVILFAVIKFVTSRGTDA